MTASAARMPDKAVIGTPGPGCVPPPTVYKPGMAVVAPGRAKMLIQPWVALPYRLPAEAGKRR